MNQSVVKALNMLELFTEDVDELTLKEIAIKANLPKPTAYRLLSSLEAMGYVHKLKNSEHDSRYRLGLKLLELGQLVADQLEVRKTALPFMESLAEQINEAVHLVIVNQHEATYIEKVESNKALRLYTRIGKSSPLYIGSGPKLLLAYLPEDEQEAIVTKTNNERLAQELMLIRERGYAFSIGEQDTDTTGISYPIYDHRNQVIAALTVSGLSSYFIGENLELIKEKTLQTAMDISNKLGYRSQLRKE
ncbi:helix-turn-helix domain-containing protein [Ornithinibacillus sp. L9]|uniref:Glycerol operon regulatory protein n=1 Tax=Ornithinibacillus caprae TaxID=2678566 RepID=A0A6N8FFN9_9BACI|nr:IclR family transcriptional regulator [Ornithinibacillus caprae]MUK88370.1 helix-turn-helix domain-containing protein [Ornithinibacillus caprae]